MNAGLHWQRRLWRFATAPFQRRTYSPRLIRPERSAGPDLTTSATASAPSMFVANRMPTPQWSLQKCSRVSAAQVLERVRVAPLHGTHAMRRCALHYRRCTSWRDCMPGIAATPSSTHAIVLEAPSQHLESQHPIRPSRRSMPAHTPLRMFKNPKKEKRKKESCLVKFRRRSSFLGALGQSFNRSRGPVTRVTCRGNQDSPLT